MAAEHLKKAEATIDFPLRREEGSFVPAGVHESERSITHTVYYVECDKKRALLKYIIAEHRIDKGIIFARTKDVADNLAKDLCQSGISAEALHDGKSENERLKSLSNVEDNAVSILVTTDSAAKNIEFKNFLFVINYELPDSADTYSDRMQRTSGSGVALSLCGHDEKGHLKNINRTLPTNLQVIKHAFV
jgi:ATP-dependent RNA helicase RhlE